VFQPLRDAAALNRDEASFNGAANQRAHNIYALSEVGKRVGEGVPAVAHEDAGRRCRGVCVGSCPGRKFVETKIKIYGRATASGVSALLVNEGARGKGRRARGVRGGGGEAVPKFRERRA
jgi:hypothetical protein